MCAGDTAVQRQARAAVRTAGTPSVPAGLLAALRNIPVDTDLPGGPDRLAMTEDGQLVAVQRAESAGPLGSGPVFGSSRPLGTSGNVLSTGGRSWHGRRAVQGAGVVAAGLMLGALAMVGPHVLGSPTEPAVDPAHGDGATVGPGVVQANFATPLGGDVRNRGGSDGGAAGAAAPAVNAGPALVSPPRRRAR
jgi:hypothetical protein